MTDKLKDNSVSDKKRNSGKIIAFSIIGGGIFVAFIALVVIMYINSGYRTAKGTFDYRLTFYNRKYEFVSSQNSLDMFRIRNINKAESDCYVYVGLYDKTQDLEETLKIVNETDKTNLNFSDTTVGSGNYPAKYVTFTSRDGGECNIYYVDYAGRNFVISTNSDKSHKGEIKKMLDSFTIIE